MGTVDQPSAHIFVHTGAVYLHQGELYLVTALDLTQGVALVEPGDPGYTTSAREVTGIDVAAELRRVAWGPVAVHFGEVDVVRQVTSFTRRNPETGQPLGEETLDLPPRALRTRAVWWTISACQRVALLAAGVDLPERRTPPSTPPSACCRCSPPATAWTSAACPPTCILPPGS